MTTKRYRKFGKLLKDGVFQLSLYNEKKLGMARQKLYDETGYSDSSIRKCENGERLPPHETIADIAKIFIKTWGADIAWTKNFLEAGEYSLQEIKAFCHDMFGTESIMESVTFPLNAEKEDTLGHKWFLKTNVILHKNGKLEGRTKIWTDNLWLGFTGGVIVQCLDKQGIILTETPLQHHIWGVDSVISPCCTSQRILQWHHAFDENIMERVTRLKILHVHPSKKGIRLRNILNEIRRGIADFINFFRV